MGIWSRYASHQLVRRRFDWIVRVRLLSRLLKKRVDMQYITRPPLRIPMFVVQTHCNLLISFIFKMQNTDIRAIRNRILDPTAFTQVSATRWDDPGMISHVIEYPGFRITKKTTVNRIEYLNELPLMIPCFSDVAFVFDLRDPKFTLFAGPKEKPKRMRPDALIRNKVSLTLIRIHVSSHILGSRLMGRWIGCW